LICFLILLVIGSTKGPRNFYQVNIDKIEKLRRGRERGDTREKENETGRI
jgi:hypothetical protein